MRRFAGQIATPIFAALSAVWPRRRELRAPVTRNAFLKGIPTTGAVLEIGPFNNPKFRGENVSYFDIMDRKSLVERARALGLDASQCPNIDHVSPTGDLASIDGTFDTIFSSHCIEHQPDLVKHLAQVEALLTPGGAYYVIIPDKRYCFDHYIGETRWPDIYAAATERRTVHTKASILNHRLLTTHNRALSHWMGRHGPKPSIEAYANRIDTALEECAQIKAGKYVDVHAWFFTPMGFLDAIKALNRIKLITIEVTKIHDTLFSQFEFFAVLQKPSQLEK